MGKFPAILTCSILAIAAPVLATTGISDLVIPGIFSVTILILGWFGTAWLNKKQKNLDTIETQRIERRDDRLRAEKQRDEALEKYWAKVEHCITIEDELVRVKRERDDACRQRDELKAEIAAWTQKHTDALAILDRRELPRLPPSKS